MKTIKINSFTIKERWEKVEVDLLKEDVRFNYNVDVRLNGEKINIKKYIIVFLSNIINANHNMKSYFHNVIHPDGFGDTSGLKVLFIKETNKKSCQNYCT